MTANSVLGDGQVRSVRLGLTGDVMLGRLVDECILADPGRDPADLWGDTLECFAAVDLRLINLECVIASAGRPDLAKVFCFRARPRALEVLRAARVDFVGLANNHALDYGSEALLECLGLLDAAGIRRAGAGRNIEDAQAPALLSAAGARIGVVALTDNEPAWEATKGRPGVHFIEYDAGGLTPPYRDGVHRTLSEASAQADFVVVCAHVGPNWGLPSPAMRALAHELLDAGADLYWGHSNHSLQGIELHDGKPILYSTGDFVDDYAVDPVERNDLSCFIDVRTQGRCVEELTATPIRIRSMAVRRAIGEDAAWVRRRLRDLSADFGTPVVEDGERAAVIFPT